MEWIKRLWEKIGDWKGIKKIYLEFFDDVVEDVVDIYDNKCVFIYLCVIW